MTLRNREIQPPGYCQGHNSIPKGISEMAHENLPHDLATLTRALIERVEIPKEPSRNLRVAKIEKFNGRSQDIDSWIDDFERYDKISRSNEEEKLTFLPLHLTGGAQCY